MAISTCTYTTLVDLRCTAVLVNPPWRQSSSTICCVTFVLWGLVTLIERKYILNLFKCVSGTLFQFQPIQAENWNRIWIWTCLQSDQLVEAAKLFMVETDKNNYWLLIVFLTWMAEQTKDKKISTNKQLCIVAKIWQNVECNADKTTV